MSDASLSRLQDALAGRYAVEREVERGGMAVVFLAADLKHPRKVAIKVLQPALAATLATDRFLREIDVLASLQHPNILTLIDSGEANGLPYYVMPFVEGQSLKERLSREGQLPVEEVVRIGGEVADALAYAHGKGVIHRDIKPGNVLLSAGHAIVADFGIAAALGEAAAGHLTETGVSLGSPAYMSPEQAAGDPDVDGRTDIYALGCALYEALVGKPPFDGSLHALVAQKMVGKVPPMSTMRADLPPALERVIAIAMAVEPAARFPSAGAFRDALTGSLTPTGPKGWRRQQTSVVAALAVVAIVALAAVQRIRTESARSRWAAELTRLEQLVATDSSEAAHSLARRMSGRAGADPQLLRVWDLISDTVELKSDPPGARVFRRPYGIESDTGWQDLGVTPLRGLRIPQTVAEYRFEAEGRESIRRAEIWWKFAPGVPSAAIELPAEGSIPAGMVWVQGGELSIGAPGFDHMPALDLPSFLLDRNEVTNAQYQEFMNAGGYANASLWTDPFTRASTALSFGEAMSRFVDRTGRAGPATWEAGRFPERRDNHPVGGLSWFEARAYARYAGKELPTMYHWTHAVDQWIAGSVVPASNLEAEEPWAAGRGGMGRFGARDMAGNVREWLVNASGHERFTIGGGWSDAAHLFNTPQAQSPWDRSPLNGMRLARYPDPRSLDEASRSLVQPFRNFRVERPASDDLYAVYQRMYDYDPIALEARVESADTTADWIRERITYRSPYSDERIAAYLFLPRQGTPPFQTVVYFPGSAASFIQSFAHDWTSVWDFLVTTGRAVLYPAFYGTYERHVPGTSTQPDASTRYRDNMIRWGRDFRRAVEYAATRPDLDSERMGYLGFSWGGRQAPIMLTREPRIAAAVLLVAGLKFQTMLPEVDPFNFVTRVRTPTLVLNGKTDNVFPEESSQIPFFDLLGTPAEHKKRVTYEGAHFVPRSVLIENSLDWLDRYLGKVK